MHVLLYMISAERGETWVADFSRDEIGVGQGWAGRVEDDRVLNIEYSVIE